MKMIVVLSRVGIMTFALMMLFGVNTVFAQATMDRIRCQVDSFINDLGEQDYQVQIQVKVDGPNALDVWVENPLNEPGSQLSDMHANVPSIGGTISVDWDSSPDLLPDGSIPDGVKLIDKLFVKDGDFIVAHARNPITLEEIPTMDAPCDVKVPRQFRQQTKPPKICDLPKDQDKLDEGKCIVP